MGSGSDGIFLVPLTSPPTEASLWNTDFKALCTNELCQLTNTFQTPHNPYLSSEYTRTSMYTGQEIIGTTRHWRSIGAIRRIMRSSEKLAAESTVRYVSITMFSGVYCVWIWMNPPSRDPPVGNNKHVGSFWKKFTARITVMGSVSLKFYIYLYKPFY